MRIGEPGPAPRRQAGFTYVGLLLAVALTGLTLAALAQRQQQQVQRERERELLFQGEAIIRALESYRKHTPPGQAGLPQRLDALLEDRRDGSLRRHLRRIPIDPMTGRPDWDWLRQAGASGTDVPIIGVRSRSDRVMLRRDWHPHGGASAVSTAAAPADAPSAPNPVADGSRRPLRASDIHFQLREATDPPPG